MIGCALILLFMLKIVNCQDIITTIAGSSTSGGYSGDNGQATAAGLYYPYGVRVDAAGELAISYY